MDLESESSIVESVEDRGEIKNVSVSDKLGNNGEIKVQGNGSHVLGNDGGNELILEMKGKGTEVLGSSSSRPGELKQEISPSPPLAKKGYGLKKWRRIKRDVSKGGDSRVDTGKVVTHDLSNSVVSSSKRVQVYAERNQKSEGSASSTNAVVKSFDGFALLGDPGVPMGPLFAAGTDSENSEDRSSKSSTAASVPKVKYERSVIVGIADDKGRMRTSSGKNLTHSGQRGQSGKGRTETSKKARGERVKIEKENSRSSMESDSRSSNVVFMQGNYSTSNGMRNGRPFNYDGEIGDEVQGSERQVNDGFQGGYGRDSEGGYENISPEDVVADSSWEAKDERSNNHDSSTDQDPLVESISALQSTQEALEREVLKFKEIGKDVSVDESILDLLIKGQLYETTFEPSPSEEGIKVSSQGLASEVTETPNKDLERELDLFKQKFEAEVEYLVLSTTLQNLRVAAVDQIAILEEQRTPISDRNQKLDKLEDSKNKAVMPEKEAAKLESISKDIAIADETLKLQKKVCKYTSCFFVQLVVLVVILGVFVSQLSPNYVEVVPT